MLPSLTALRFFAILLIYFHHLEYPFGFGSAGVTFFFVLSGFIIAYNYNRKFICINADEVMRFLIKRLSKIYPLHILTFVLSLPIVYLTNFDTTIYYALSNIFLLQSYLPIGKQVFSFNALAWFISNMFFFYLLTPFLLNILYKYKIAQSPKALLWLLIIVFLGETAMACLFIHQIQPYSFGWWFVYISPYLRLFDYIIGVSIGLFFFNIENRISITSKRYILFSIMEVLAVLSACASMYCLRYIPFDSLKMSVCFIPFSVMVVFIFSFQNGILSSILSKKIFVYLGNLSFSIYLIHQLVINYAAIYFSSAIYGMTSETKQFISQLLLLIVIICLADVINRYFEEPLKNKILSFL